MAKPIKILHVNDKFDIDGVNPHGVTMMLKEWFLQHDPDRFEIEVVGLRAPNPASDFLKQSGVHLHHIDRGKVSPWIISDLSRIARDFSPDILHLHGFSSANFGRIVARRHAIPCVMHEHASLPFQPHQYLADWSLRSWTDASVAVSNSVRDYMVSGRSVDETKVQVIANGISLDRIRAVTSAEVEEFKAKVGVSPHERLVGTVTRLTPEKGPEDFVAAAAALNKNEPDVRFVIVGDGSMREELESQAQQLGLSDKLVFTGYLTNVPAALAAMDIVVFSSHREGFGVAMLEAMAAGKPVVATNIDGFAELLRHDTSALLAPARSSAALAAQVRRLLDDDDLAKRLSKGALARAEEFSIENSVRQLEDLYQELALKGRG